VRKPLRGAVSGTGWDLCFRGDIPVARKHAFLKKEGETEAGAPRTRTEAQCWGVPDLRLHTPRDKCKWAKQPRMFRRSMTLGNKKPRRGRCSMKATNKQAGTPSHTWYQVRPGRYFVSHLSLQPEQGRARPQGTLLKNQERGHSL